MGNRGTEVGILGAGPFIRCVWERAVLQRAGLPEPVQVYLGVAHIRERSLLEGSINLTKLYLGNRWMAALKVLIYV